MIKMIRLDERLIHGQVATKWSRLLEIDRILVADDIAANNNIMKQSLLMAAPSQFKTVITSVDRAIELCNDARSEKLSVLVIVSSPDSLLKMVENVKCIEKVNIGNYGRIANKRDTARETYNPNLYLYSDEVEVLRRVIEVVGTCTLQTIPEDMPISLEKLLNHS